MTVCVDESAFYLLPSVVRTYAPRGEMPFFKVLLTHKHLSVVSGITAAGHPATMTLLQLMTGQERAVFLRHSSDYLDRKLLVIWDRLNIHQTEEVKMLLSCGWARLMKFQAYAPDLNPDKGVWQHLKHFELCNLMLCGFGLARSQIGIGH